MSIESVFNSIREDGVWGNTSIIPVLRRLGQEDCHEFKASLGYRVRLSQKYKARGQRDGWVGKALATKSDDLG